MFETGTYKVTSGPASEPLTASDVKAWLKVSGNDEDAIITLLISAARESAEKYLRMALITQTITEKFSRFEDYGLRLSVSPLISVTQVQYIQPGGSLTTLSNSIYDLLDETKPPLVYRKYGQSFPTVEPSPEAVQVTYTAGFGATGASTPTPIKLAMLLMIADWFDNRTDAVRTMPTASRILLDQFRVNYF